MMHGQKSIKIYLFFSWRNLFNFSSGQRGTWPKAPCSCGH